MKTKTEERKFVVQHSIKDIYTLWDVTISLYTGISKMDKLKVKVYIFYLNHELSYPPF